MTIFEEAEAIVNGARQDDYGPPERNLASIGKAWEAVLGHAVTGKQVALCMVMLKIVREANREKRDNLVDAAGYLRLYEMLGLTDRSA